MDIQMLLSALSGGATSPTPMTEEERRYLEMQRQQRGPMISSPTAAIYGVGDAGSMQTSDLGGLRQNTATGGRLNPTGTGVSDMRSTLETKQRQDTEAKESSRAAFLERMIKSGDPDLQAQAQALFAQDQQTQAMGLEEQKITDARELGRENIAVEREGIESRAPAYEAEMVKAEAAMKQALSVGDPVQIKLSLFEYISRLDMVSREQLEKSLEGSGMTIPDFMASVFTMSDSKLKEVAGAISSRAPTENVTVADLDAQLD